MHYDSTLLFLRMAVLLPLICFFGRWPPGWCKDLLGKQGLCLYVQTQYMNSPLLCCFSSCSSLESYVNNNLSTIYLWPMLLDLVKPNVLCYCVLILVPFFKLYFNSIFFVGHSCWNESWLTNLVCLSDWLSLLCDRSWLLILFKIP